MTDKAIGLAGHFDHARFEEASSVFEAFLVEFRGELDRLAEQKHAASERQG